TPPRSLPPAPLHLTIRLLPYSANYLKKYLYETIERRPLKQYIEKRRRLKVSTRPLKFYLAFIPNIPQERRASIVIGLISSPWPSVISKKDSPASFLSLLIYCLSDRYGDKSSSNIDSPLRACVSLSRMYVANRSRKLGEGYSPFASKYSSHRPSTKLILTSSLRKSTL